MSLFHLQISLVLKEHLCLKDDENYGWDEVLMMRYDSEWLHQELSIVVCVWLHMSTLGNILF
jgi:hypothetical protein